MAEGETLEISQKGIFGWESLVSLPLNSVVLHSTVLGHSRKCQKCSHYSLSAKHVSKPVRRRTVP